MILDIRTLYLMFSILTMTMALTLFFALQDHFRKGERLLIAVLGLHAAATLLLSLRGIIPDFLSILVAQIMMTSAFAMSYMAVCRFYDLKENLLLIALPMAATLGEIVALHSVSQRTIGVGLICMFQHLFVIMALAAGMKRKKSRGLIILLLCNGLAMLAFLIRMVTAIIHTDWYATFFAPTNLQSVTLMMLFISVFFFCIGFFILHRERKEEEIIEARDQAMAANRAKSTFLANMSHEIRTPMNAVLGFTELLSLKVTDLEQRRYLEIIDINGKALLGLINDILDLSKIEAGGQTQTLSHGPVDLAKMGTEIKEMISAGLNDMNLAIIIDMDPGLPRLLALDELKLRQVLINLVGNAVKFTETGSITIRVKVLSRREGGLFDIAIIVKDTGIGIAPEDQESVFEAFVQKKSAQQYRGTGLGLTITKRLVEMMGGTISLESEPGTGSTFTVTLRGIPEIGDGGPAEREKELPVTPEPHASASSLLVLIVDDVMINRILLRSMLEQNSCRVLEACGGEEALKVAAGEIPDLVFMDIRMPGIDGYETTKRFKADPRLSGIPVIALTAQAMDDEEEKAREAGCTGFIRKPFSESDIVSVLWDFFGDRIAPHGQPGSS